MYSDPTPTRIDYLKYELMVKLSYQTHRVKNFVANNPEKDYEDYIRQVAENIEEIFDGKVGPAHYVKIVNLLKDLAVAVKASPSEKQLNVTYANHITDRIIETVQGDNKMDKNTMTVMTFRRVKEAISDVALANDFTDERITIAAEEYASKIVNDVFGGKTPAELQASEFVVKYYEMDPETEDVLDNGTLVINGMKVLPESAAYRAGIHDHMSEEETYRARRLNRWCTVAESKVDGRPEGKFLTFVAVYDDGTKAKRTEPIETAWIVKKDSIPRVDSILDIRSDVVFKDVAKQVVRILMEEIKPRNFGRYKVRVGLEGDVISSAQYLINEGVIDKDPYGGTFTVRDEEGTSVVTGNIDEIVKWSVKNPNGHEYYDIGREDDNSSGFVKLQQFLTEYYS